MKREIAKRWVEALTSGKYEQTTGKLQRTEPGENGEPVGFCCLGVLCELAVADGVIPPAFHSDLLSTGMYGKSGVCSTLPDEVQEWAEVEVDDPRLEPGPAAASYLNDTVGKTFEELAEAIKLTYLAPRRGDKVLFAIGSWYKGRFVDNDREVEGTVIVRYDDGSLLIHTHHGQKPNACQTAQTVKRMLSEVELVEEAGV